MESQKEDRRIRRTQKMLKDSLIELMTERDFKNISVKDITERADLNRGTFYNHYTDTYDLLQKMESDVLADFQDMIDNFLCSSKNGSLMPILLPVIKLPEFCLKTAHPVILSTVSISSFLTMEPRFLRNSIRESTTYRFPISLSSSHSV